MVGKEFEDGKTQELAHPEIVEVLALLHRPISVCSRLVCQVVFSVFHLCPAPLQLNILDRVYSLVERSTINMAVRARSCCCDALLPCCPRSDSMMTHRSTLQLLSENRTLEFILAALTKVDTLDNEVCGKLLHGVFVFASFKISVKQFKVMLGLTRTKDGKRVRD